jgi:pimeloyl-ACP methyl ester carboxylesterase
LGRFVNQAETITLADGRALCYARYGAPGGKPVIYLCGGGMSRIDGEHFDAEARKSGVEIIATDRPGCGGSSPDPDRTFLSYANDLKQLADQLGIPRFVVAGMSNGGAYAMAAAAHLPDRVSAVIPINSSTPVSDPAARKVSPLIVRLGYTAMKCDGVARFAKSSRDRIIKAPDTDSRVRRAMSEADAQPASGYIKQEMRLAASAWGFDHTAVAQPVDIFTGDRDGGFRYAPVWATKLRSGRVHVFAGGHGDYTAPDVVARIVKVMAAALP